MSFLSRSNWPIYLTAALFSLLLSYDGFLRAAVINSDGICYLQSAAAIGSAGLHPAMQLCDQAQWPFYSILIFSVAFITQLSNLQAAFVLDGFFSLISVMAFIYLVRLLGASKNVLWLAAGVILLSHELNSVREYIIRDHGFWAFYLLAVIFLLRYLRSFQWHDALFFSVTMIIATLFRIEGLVFLLFMPLIVWAYQSQSLGGRLRAFLTLNMITILTAIGLLTWLIVTRHTASRLLEVQFQLTHGVSQLITHFQGAAKALADHVLSPYAARDAYSILFLMLVVWYSFSVISNVAFVYMFLVIFAWWRQLLRLDQAAKLVLWGFILVNILITAAFLVENLFLSKRYLIALSLIFMVWVPFALDHLIQQRRVHPYLLSVIVVFIMVSSVGGIFNFGYSKSYIRDAGYWLASHTPEKAMIYSNDEQVMYYSDRFGNDIFAKSKLYADLSQIADNQWKQYDYLALRLSKKEFENIVSKKEWPLTPMQVFSNKRGDSVVVYRVIKENSF